MTLLTAQLSKISKVISKTAPVISKMIGKNKICSKINLTFTYPKIKAETRIKKQRKTRKVSILMGKATMVKRSGAKMRRKLCS